LHSIFADSFHVLHKQMQQPTQAAFVPLAPYTMF